MGSPFLTAALILGGLVAEDLGPTWWRVYWIVYGVLVARGGWLVWRRLRLGRMAAGLVLGGCIFAAFALVGTSRAIANYWVWFLSALIVMVALFLWEGRRSADRLRVLQAHSRRAPWHSVFTWEHVPDLERERDAHHTT